MRILILTTVLAPYRIDLFNALGRFCDLTVCFETESDATRNAEWYKTKAEHFNMVCLKHWDKPFYMIRREALSYLQKTQVDAAIAFEYSTPTAMAFMLRCRRKGIPYLINCDGAHIRDSWLKRIIKRFFIRRAAMCCASGRRAGEYFKHYGAADEQIHYHPFTSLSKAELLDDLVSNEQKAALKTALQLSYPKIGVVATRFLELKRIDVLIEAWSRLSPDYHLIIIGRGEMESSYREQVARLGLCNVHIIGHQTREVLFDYFKASDLLVFPTSLDVWGLVVNEAMACGLPVVTTPGSVAGLELIEDGVGGYIVPVGDADMLAEKLDAVLSDNALRDRMGRFNLERIRGYTVEASAEAFLKAIAQVVG